MTADDVLKAPHAAKQPTVSLREGQIQIADMYRLKAIHEGNDDLRVYYENQLRELRKDAA